MRIAVVPARKGSKRVKQKNTRSFLGTPVLLLCLERLISFRYFDKIIVSSDSEETLEMISGIPDIVGIKRPDHLATDTSGTREVVFHALENLEFIDHDSIVFCIYPTSLFFYSEDLVKAEFRASNYPMGYVFSAGKIDNSGLRSFYLGENGELHFANKKFIEFRSQDLPITYKDAGQFYCAGRSTWLTYHEIISETSTFIELNRRFIDINTETDWDLAEKLFLELNQRDHKELGE